MTFKAEVLIQKVVLENQGNKGIDLSNKRFRTTEVKSTAIDAYKITEKDHHMFKCSNDILHYILVSHSDLNMFLFLLHTKHLGLLTVFHRWETCLFNQVLPWFSRCIFK